MKARSPALKLDMARREVVRRGKRIAQLEEALGFYADEKTWEPVPIETRVLGGPPALLSQNSYSTLMFDQGHRARVALSPSKENVGE